MNQPSSKIKSSTSPVYVQLLTGVSSFASGFLSVYAPQRGKLHETMLQPRNFFLSKNFFAESLDNSMPEWYSNHCRTAAGVVELVDTGDLKSPGSDTVPVRARSPAPSSYRGVEQLVARRAHNPEVAGSSPVSATRQSTAIQWIAVLFPQAARCPPYVAEPSQEAGSSPCSRFFPERRRAAPGGPIPPFDKHTPLRYAEQRGLLRRRYPWRSTLFHTAGLVKEGSSCASAAFLRRRPRCWRRCCA